MAAGGTERNCIYLGGTELEVPCEHGCEPSSPRVVMSGEIIAQLLRTGIEFSTHTHNSIASVAREGLYNSQASASTSAPAHAARRMPPDLDMRSMEDEVAAGVVLDSLGRISSIARWSSAHMSHKLEVGMEIIGLDGRQVSPDAASRALNRGLGVTCRSIIVTAKSDSGKGAPYQDVMLFFERVKVLETKAKIWELISSLNKKEQVPADILYLCLNVSGQDDEKLSTVMPRKMLSRLSLCAKKSPVSFILDSCPMSDRNHDCNIFLVI